MKLIALIMLLSSVASAQAEWKLAPVSSLSKLTASQNGVLDSFSAAPIQLKAARGEWESFQFVVTAGQTPITDLEIVPNGLGSVTADYISSQNLHIYRENYVYVAHPSGNRVLTPKWWPDALIPLDLSSKSIEANRSAVFWGALKVPDDAVPGDYYGEIDFKADGAPRRLALTLSVSAQILPAPTFRACVAVYYDVLRDWYAKNAAQTFSDADWELQKKRYYDFLLDFGLNAYDLPVSWSSPEAENYLRNPRVLSVRTPALDHPDFSLALAKFKATGTLQKAVYYWIDEPQTPADFARVRETTAQLRKIGVKHLVTAHPSAALRDSVDIWCPNVGDFFGINHLDRAQLQKERSKGREVWLYTMVEPKYPAPTWLLDDEAASIRAYASLWAHFGATGFVYSMAHGWGPKPLDDLTSFAGTNGDGTLLYPAELVGGSGPMPSIRLMLLREAIQDWELGRVKPPFSAPQTLVSTPGIAAITRPDAPPTLLTWKTDARHENLVVHFSATSPQPGDYVAVELAPADISLLPFKWRFVATLRGQKIIEKMTREGRFRFEDKNFRVVINAKSHSTQVQMTIPLAELNGAKPFRFDALRRTVVNGARIIIYARSQTGDPAQMPIIDLREQKRSE